jgi:peptidoglycan/xylan/chitin deacetylase (PgdA/CDA1 family)
VLVLAYHNVLPDGEPACGEAALHLSAERFIKQLELLGNSCDVVPLANVLDPTPPLAAPRVAITFDDAYAGAVRVALPELSRRGLPATIFVAPGLLDGRAFWWDALAVSPQGITDEARRHALDQCRGQDAAVRRWASENGIRLVEPPELCRSATEGDLQRAAAGTGLTFGVHSWSHPNLAALVSAELVAELVQPLSWLRDRFTRVLPWIAYPYGQAPRDTRAVRLAGLEVGMLVTGGWFPRSGVERYAVPRFNVPAGLSLDGFRLRLAGLLLRE